MTTYAAGLRVSEAIRLTVKDIDSERMMIFIRKGKRAKDRYTILSKRLLSQLRIYWPMYKPKDWLFTGNNPATHIADSTVRGVFTMAKAKASITKTGGIHMLRHSFATHMRLCRNCNSRTCDWVWQFDFSDISLKSNYLFGFIADERLISLFINKTNRPLRF
jgi:site-specific recombinase XerD